MKFFLDHDVPESLAGFLVQRGHVVLRLREVLPVTAPDAEVFAFAQRERAVVVSCNRNHFLSLATASQPHGGLIVLISGAKPDRRNAPVCWLCLTAPGRTACRATSTSRERRPLMG